jgi:thiamine-phosphate pyrophosphorylase
MKVVDHTILRLLDANLNRAAEGLRVLEEYARMVLDNASLSLQAKAARHSLNAIIRSEPLLDREALFARDTASDVFSSGTTDSENNRTDPVSLLRANAKRVEEALRSLEEYGKLLSPTLAEQFKAVRFSVYALEQRLVGAEARRDILSGEWTMGVRFDLDSGVPKAETLLRLNNSGLGLIVLSACRMNDREFARRAGELIANVSGTGMPVLVEHRLDSALVSGAAGVIIDGDDIPPAACRSAGGQKFIIAFDSLAADSLSPAQEDEIDAFFLRVTDGGHPSGIGELKSPQLRKPLFLFGINSPVQLAAVDLTRIAGIIVSFPEANRKDPESGLSSYMAYRDFFRKPDLQ